MCGIIGYVGREQAAPILLQGLEKLEYRGYDSAGVAVYDGTSIEIAKAKGKLRVLADKIRGGADIPGTVGIGHTRWATHGRPSDLNAHPQVSGSEKFAVVHNGIIENYSVLRDFLLERGFHFVSDTDTEVVAQMIEFFYEGDFPAAVAKTLRRIEGSYALAILCKDFPDRILAVCKDSPLAVGFGKDENFIVSDIPAVLSRTRDICRLEANEIAVVRQNDVTIYGRDGKIVPRRPTHISWDISAAEKGGYDHFMEKEIMEQPKAVRDTVSPRIKGGKIVLDDIALTEEQLRDIRKIDVIACGSAYHAGAVAKYVLEQFTRIPVEIDVSSEFRYRRPIVDKSVLALVISQSGETADTLAALREAKRRGARTIAIVNVVGSSIANEAKDVLYTWAGPEAAVATTKGYSAQLAVVYLLAVYIADKLGVLSEKEYAYYVSQLGELPEKIEKALSGSREAAKTLAARFCGAKDVFFIGRNLDYAIAMEGSLKLKEIAYIHSEAYAAGELKHGTISLIEEGTPVVALATQTRLFGKMMGSIREARARGAVVLGLTTENNRQIEKETDFHFYIPKVCEMMTPSLAVAPLQMFAYSLASLKGCDIDKPRNLSKSVTVE